MNSRQISGDGVTNNLPIYRQIATELWSEVQSGVLPAGQRLPNEAALAERFGVTRLTLRQAISELQRLGAVEIRRGIGTFVVTPPDLVEIVASVPRARQASDAMALALDGQAGESTGQPGQPGRSARPVRKVDEMLLAVGAAAGALGEAAAEHLGVPMSQIDRLDTVMLSGGRRWISNSYWYRRDIGPIPEQLEVYGTVVGAFNAVLGDDLQYLWRAFSAIAADFEDAETLHVPVGTALLVRDGVSAGADGRPAYYVRRRLRGDEARFVLRYDTER